MNFWILSKPCYRLAVRISVTSITMTKIQQEGVKKRISELDSSTESKIGYTVTQDNVNTKLKIPSEILTNILEEDDECYLKE